MRQCDARFTKIVLLKASMVKKKLATKIKKLGKLSFILELWYYHHIVIVEITHKIRTSFKTLASKKAATWRLKKSQSNDKLS